MRNELRRDYILEKYTIVQNSSNLGPQNYVQKQRIISDLAVCGFCNLDPRANILDEIKDDEGNWILRVLSNVNHIVKMEGNPVLTTDNRYFTFANSYGSEEVIVESPNHNTDYSELSEEIIQVCLKKSIERINKLEKLPYVAHVSLFKNQGFQAGSYTTHSHSQIVAHTEISNTIKNEIAAIKEFTKINNVCPYCDFQRYEKSSYRRVFETNTFVSMTPYSSEYPFEVRIYPKRHIGKITQLDVHEIADLAKSLKEVLTKLKQLNYPSYNIVYITSPVDEVDFHFYVRILPRLSKRAGFEIITGTMVNPISPEVAAKFYRGEL